MNRFWVITALAALIAAPSGISRALADEAPPAPHRRPAPADASVSFANLKDGAVVPPTFTVRFGVQGMEVVPAGTDQPNSGHHHLLIDVADLPDPNLPLPKTGNILHFGGGQTETELTLPEGPHTLQLLFADYAHVPHNPVVRSARITVTVSADAAAE